MQSSEGVGALALDPYEPLRFQNSTFNQSPNFVLHIANSTTWCFPEDVLDAVIEHWADEVPSRGSAYVAWLIPVVVIPGGTQCSHKADCQVYEAYVLGS